ncbi:MAG: hypothetical protein QXO51_07785 [Halobacteria archaeon]
MKFLRLPVWAGNLASLALLGLGAFLLLAAKKGALPGFALFQFQTPLLNFLLAAVLLLLGVLLLFLFSHCIAHWLVGRLLGIRFTHYFVGTSGIARLLPLPDLLQELLVAPGIAVDDESKRTAGRGRLAAMYAAGPVVSTLFLLGAAAFALTVPVPELRLLGLPLHSLFKLLLAGLAVAGLGSLVVASPRAGCVGKAARAWSRRPAREQPRTL